MRLAAIDIGSNAVRLQVSRILFEQDGTPIHKNMEYIRFPLRLGTDVFKTGELTFRTEAKFIELIKAFRTLIDLYEVDDLFPISRTSAMRSAANGKRILKRAYEKSGIKIELIDGELEADLINRAVSQAVTASNYIGIDVGGGSTEISTVHDGLIRNRKSFELGSVRNMQGRETDAEWESLESWLKDNIQAANFDSIGTGGNIRSILKFIGDGNGDECTIKQLQAANDHIKTFSLYERIQKLRLREDRADVITYAIDIYLRVMNLMNSQTILVPNTGLKDGIIDMLYERNR